MNEKNREKFDDMNLTEWLEKSNCRGKNIKFASCENTYNNKDLDSHPQRTRAAFLEILPEAVYFDVSYRKEDDDITQFIEDCILNKVDIIFWSRVKKLNEKQLVKHQAAMKKAKDNGMMVFIAGGNGAQNGTTGNNLETLNLTHTSDAVVVSEAALSKNKVYFQMGTINNIDCAGRSAMWITKYNSAWSGSSFTTPLVASICGLMLDYLRGNNVQATAVEAWNEILFKDIGEESMFGKGLALMPDFDNFKIKEIEEMDYGWQKVYFDELVEDGFYDTADYWLEAERWERYKDQHVMNCKMNRRIKELAQRP